MPFLGGDASGFCLISDIGVFGVSRVRFPTVCFVSIVMFGFPFCCCWHFLVGIPPRPTPSPLRHACVGCVVLGRARRSLRIGFSLVIRSNKYGTSGTLLLALRWVTLPRHSAHVIIPPGKAWRTWSSFSAFFPPLGGGGFLVSPSAWNFLVGIYLG